MNSALFSFVRRCSHLLCQAIKWCLRQCTKPNDHTLLLNVTTDSARGKPELVLENAFLRQQLIILKRRGKRPTLTQHDRVLFVLLASKLRSWRQAMVIVQPDTLLRWHRDLFRWVWKRRSRPRQKGGRAPPGEDIVALIKRMAVENQSWGADRIRGELLKLGLRVAKSTIQGLCWPKMNIRSKDMADDSVLW
jgi:putative transposase